MVVLLLILLSILSSSARSYLCVYLAHDQHTNPQLCQSCCGLVRLPRGGYPTPNFCPGGSLSVVIAMQLLIFFCVGRALPHHAI